MASNVGNIQSFGLKSGSTAVLSEYCKEMIDYSKKLNSFDNSVNYILKEIDEYWKNTGNLRKDQFFADLKSLCELVNDISVANAKLAKSLIEFGISQENVTKGIGS